MSSTATSSPEAASGLTTAAKAKRARALRIWLGTIAFLIVAMILVGGATRLTDSGLSITEWKPIMGAIPPLSDADWQQAFEAYRQIPEYAHVNPNMDLAAFKTIYWWEWAHRFLGRLIGFVFLVPFLVFWWAGYISRALLPRLAALFVIGGFQGAVGWYMVKSGLVDRVDVSQYRLMAHFGIAVLILSATLWLWLGLSDQPKLNLRRPRHAFGAAVLVLVLIYLQMLAGALVAGLDAGLGFNTWPLINGAFVPDGLAEATPWYLNLFENPLTVQFDHRMLGYVVLAATLAQAGWLALKGVPPLAFSAVAVACIALLQATLGVWTLLLAVPIELGLAHQAGAIALFIASLHHVWLVGERSPKFQTAARA